MAAASATMQSFLSSPAAQWSSRASRVASRGFIVKCSNEETPLSSTTPATPPPPPPPSAPQPSVRPTPKVSTKFSDIMAFGGPAPERINGRLAMLGFVSAMAVEVSSGQDIFAQIANGGVPLYVASSVVLTIASLIPLLKGVSVQSKSDGVMTSEAEMWNGRFAMLGLVALAFTEYVKGSALV